MAYTNYRITGELWIEEDGEKRVSSFNRDHLMFYIGMREAGLTHDQAGSKLLEKHAHGGGPHPRVYWDDELELEEPGSG